MSELLSNENFNIYTANSGYEGLEEFNSIKPKIVFLDNKMPSMDVITVLKKMKKNLIDCEIIMMTGYSEINSAIEAIKEGAFSYLQKEQINSDNIKSVIYNALKKFNRQKNILIIEDEDIIRKKIKNLQINLKKIFFGNCFNF